MKRTIIFAGSLFAFCSFAVFVRGDGGFFVRYQAVGEAADLAQTRQEVLLAFYGIAPSADDCGDANPVTAYRAYCGTTEQASNDGTYDCGLPAGTPDVWYTYTPDADGSMSASVYWSNLELDDAPADLDIAVYSGCPGDDGTLLACDAPLGAWDDLANRRLSMEVSGGVKYLIRVGDPSGLGRDFLLILHGPEAVDSDDTEDAVPYATYVLRSRYAGRPDEFAWVIPVPTTPTDVVAHESSTLFDRLDEQTRPTFWTDYYDQGSGAPGDDGGSESDTRIGAVVTVEAEGEAGIFHWAALTSTGSDALLDWLDQNDFAVPEEAEPVLDGYIEQEWHFLALRVREPEDVVLNEDGEIDIPPIQFTCQTAQRVYPMAISQVSAADETEIIVYVLAEHRAEAANLPNGVIDPEALLYDADTASQTNYEALFTQAIRDSAESALITEVAWHSYFTLAGEWTDAPLAAHAGTRLTRMRTVLTPEQMDLDFEFQDAPDDGEVTNYFVVAAPPDADFDRVPDDEDTCADTPPGEEVNGSGCSCSQIVCDDGDPCTVDSCTSGVCAYVPVQCDDGLFCNGSETCVGGECVDGEAPCDPNDFCDEVNDGCVTETQPPGPVPCTMDADCDDGLYCNGAETCVENECVEGTAPCGTGEVCDERFDLCVRSLRLCGTMGSTLAVVFVGILSLRLIRLRSRSG